MRRDTLTEQLAEHGQEHVLCFWDELSQEQRAQLSEEIMSLDLALVARLAAGAGAAASEFALSAIGAPNVIGIPKSDEEEAAHRRAAECGWEILAAGEAAVMLVAGGQASRLGYDLPKGQFPIGPVTGKSLFQIHAEKILAMSRRIGRAIPWLVMTSKANDTPTKRFFEENDVFGLDRSSVDFFQQGMLPAVDGEGKMLLAGKHRLALAPNGHGGSILALHDSGVLEKIRSAGVKHVFYFQVDNPLVSIADPAFLGFHAERGAGMSLKVVEKTEPSERIGIVVAEGERMRVIEYSDLPDEAAHARDPDGRLLLRAGSIGIHALSVAFLDELLAGDFSLPYHVANKKVAHVNDAGVLIEPDAPNARKFETFIFDALPLSERTVVMETIRQREFAPVKNPAGVDSPESAQALMQDEWRRWIVEAGLMPDAAPLADRKVEIGPLYALDCEAFKSKAPALPASGDILFNTSEQSLYQEGERRE